MKKKVSIYDIARELKISTATVSFVINGKDKERRISDELAQKVRDHVARTGFQANQVARSLRTGKSRMIGMLVEDIADPFFSKVAGLIEAKVRKQGYKLFVSSTYNDALTGRAALEIFRNLQADAYIVAPPPGMEDDINGLLKSRLPLVLFDRYYPGIETNNVIVDNYSGSVQAVNHFAENNFSNIGFITIDSVQTQMKDRLTGFNQTIEKHLVNGYVKKLRYGVSEQSAIKSILLFIRENPQIDALLFATNYLAIAGLKALRTVPEFSRQIAVIGFDDMNYHAIISPALTAVSQPLEGIAAAIVDKLTAELEDETAKPVKQTAVLPVTLKIRASSRLSNTGLQFDAVIK